MILKDIAVGFGWDRALGFLGGEDSTDVGEDTWMVVLMVVGGFNGKGAVDIYRGRKGTSIAFETHFRCVG